MSSKAMYNFHLPLPSELHDMLREEVERSGEPATMLAREALRDWLILRRKKRLYAEIAAFASEHAGTELDLDENLERAGIESVLGEDPR